MEKGKAVQEKTTTSESRAEYFRQVTIEAIAQEVGLDEAERNISMFSQSLDSRHNSGVESDDRVTIIYYGDHPAALILETRDEFNMVDVSYSYFGPNRPGQLSAR